MKKKENSLIRLLNDFESHVAAVLFFLLTILLTIQVISRYVFNYAFTWTEELANIVYVYIVYLGVSAAVTYRKHLSIDFFLEMSSFKVKRALLIISDVIFIIFCIVMMSPLMKIVIGYNGLGGAKSPLLSIPKVISFGIIPLCFLFTIVRLVQDIMKLLKEEEKELGVSKPTIDLNAAELEWKEKQKLYRDNIRKGGNI